ncbi:cytochrome P450 [Variovorax sp. J22R24]|uniref:cytochrome P450 n=1 Tax=Variovorax gracilis TaxID=3053502 RepID=UPI002574CF2D|nr:cytochrome P450 [Variovorax sp. J22R24]MDM0106901.1 cytochrome P450 [Variovorax sp. J22R24]
MKHMDPPADAIAAVTHCNPYPWYATLRNGPALVRDERLHVWVASRADIVREVLANDALRVRPPTEPVPGAIAGTPAGKVFGRLVRMNDGATHAAHKPVLQRALAGLDLRAAYATVLQVADGMPAESPSDACFAMPVRGVAHLLGFASEALPRVSDWVRDFVACLSPLSTAAQLDAASEAAAALMARFESLIVARPARHGTLLAAVQEQAPADRSRALVANLVGLLSQTCEATAGLLGNSLVALAREPGLRRRVDSRWELLPALVDEVARHDPSIQNTRRFVAQPTTIAGIELAPGEAVLVVLGAANRDPSLNPAPATFELMRAERRTLGFGQGPHACPGQALAGTVAAAGLQALLSRGLDADALLERGWNYRPSVNARIPTFHRQPKLMQPSAIVPSEQGTARAPHGPIGAAMQQA